jgi:TolB-like protein/Flp pilus assembly protein TadD
VVTPDGRLKILDFGLAKLLPRVGEKSQIETVTSSDAVSGTLPYMAPEQLRGETVDARTDIFALGAVLYEMATGKRPFPEESSPRLIDAILHQTPVTPRAVKASVSPELERVVLKCLEKDPTLRYQSATDIGVDMRRLAAPTSGDSAVAPAPSASRARPEWLAVGAVVVAVAALVAFYWFGAREQNRSAALTEPIESLAVLPLENLSGDPEQEYFVDGMTEAIIANLAKIGALRVISRTSIMQYKDARKPLPQIGRELNVDAIVEGSVLRAGDRVRITAQLVRAPTDTHLWAESYEGDLHDVLELQGEVAREIAREIEVTVTAQEEERVTRSRQVAPEIYDLYLRGRQYGDTFTEDGLEKALEYFNKAIEADPVFALPHLGIANSYWDLSAIYLPPDEAMPKARAAAARALELDETLGEAHGLLAVIMSNYDWEFEAAEPIYLRALELSPGSSRVRMMYGTYLVAMGRKRDATVELNRARELGPLDPMTSVMASLAFRLGPPDERDYDRAIQILQEALSLHPRSSIVHRSLGDAYAGSGQFAEALDSYQEAYSLSPDHNILGYIGYVYALSGEQAKAEQMLAELLELREHRYVGVSMMAALFLALGDKESALDWLQEGYDSRDEGLIFLKVSPWWDTLRADPRFKDLVRRVGLPLD